MRMENPNGDKCRKMTCSHVSVIIKRKPVYEIVKRLFDIIFSVSILIGLCPLWIIAAIGIKISSHGPVFYMANRVGKGKKLFKMFKFRSMHMSEVANEKSLRPEQARIFKFGQFMRSTKLDELPQVLNVLWGSMTVVGPRPAAKDQVEITRAGKYEVLDQIKPGLTSPSALFDYIYGDSILYDTEYEREVLPTRLALDLYYLKARGVSCDLKIVFYTAWCIILNIFKRRPMKIYSEFVSVAGHYKASN